MNPQESYDLIDGKKVPQTYIREDHELMGTHNGTVNVESGVFILSGKLQGTLGINTTSPSVISGKQQGTVNISSGAHVTVTGTIQGTTNISHGATLVIESTGKLSGSLTNNGTLIIRGVFGGAQSGNGQLIIEDNGYIKEPTVKNGISYYEC